MKSGTLFRTAIVMVLLPAAGAISAGEAEDTDRQIPPFTISPQTTYVEGPLNEDGTVNYVAYLNEKLSQNVTADNNAAVLMIQALGPGPLPPNQREEVYDRLGMAPLPKDGDYFVWLRDYVAEAAPDGDTDEWMFQRKVEQALHDARVSFWSAEEHPLLAEWIEANSEPLRLFRRAPERPRYYLPLISNISPPVLRGSYLQFNLVEPGRALAARAMLAAARGDIESAKADLLAVHRLARLIREQPNQLNLVMATALESSAVRGATAISKSGLLDSDQAEQWLSVIRRMGDPPNFTDVVRQKRLAALDAVFLCYRYGVMQGLELTVRVKDVCVVEFDIDEDAIDDCPLRSRSHWDTALRTINRFYDLTVEYEQAETFAERQRLWAKYDARHRKLAEAVVTGSEGLERFADNVRRAFMAAMGHLDRQLGRDIGSIILVLRESPLGTLPELQTTLAAEYRLALCSLALAAYHAEQGHYPEELGELIPQFLPAVLQDPFDEAPLRYRATEDGYVLYSVGPSGIDHGGIDDEQMHKDDILIRVK